MSIPFKPKGYYTSSIYQGWVGNMYMVFETEQAYYDYLADKYADRPTAEQIANGPDKAETEKIVKHFGY